MYSTYYNTSYIEKVYQSFLTIIVQNSPRNPQKCHVLREDFADHQRYQVQDLYYTFARNATTCQVP